MRQIYISGAISDIPLTTAQNRFSKGQLIAQRWSALQSFNRQCTTHNPLHIRPLFGIRKWFFHMVTDVICLYRCDTILMLDGWEQSAGACIEHAIAIRHKKKRLYEYEVVKELEGIDSQRMRNVYKSN